MRETPRPGELYRHFKNRLYQVIAVASDAETEAPLVVYQALYGDFRFWVRPLENFLSRTDREKYPDAAQEWRFERVTPAQAAEMPQAAALSQAAEIPQAEAPSQEAETAQAEAQTESAGSGREVLLKFLDAETPDEKKAALMTGMNKLTQKELDSIYMAMDMPAAEGDVRTQVSAILSWIRTRERFEGDRLRNGRGGIISRRNG